MSLSLSTACKQSWAISGPILFALDGDPRGIRKSRVGKCRPGWFLRDIRIVRNRGNNPVISLVLSSLFFVSTIPRLNPGEYSRESASGSTRRGPTAVVSYGPSIDSTMEDRSRNSARAISTGTEFRAGHYCSPRSRDNFHRFTQIWSAGRLSR